MASWQDSTHPTGVGVDGPDRRKKTDWGQDVAVAARGRKAEAALSLRLSGASWTDIARTLGYPTPRATMLAVERALVKRLDDEDRTKMRQMAGARLERLLQAVWSRALDTTEPEQMVGVNRARELIADYRKLYGLDAPTEIMVHTPTQVELEAWVLRMTATMVPEVVEPDIFDAEVVEEVEAS